MKYCPVCYAPDPAETCAHCGADVDRIRKIRLLEHAAEEHEPLAMLPEIVRIYHDSKQPAAMGRILGRLVSHSLRAGNWLEAQHFLESILAMGEAGGSAAFIASTKRQLGLLLGRRGELPLAYHLLSQAEQAGDSLALVDKLRLEIDEAAKLHLMQTLAKLETGDLSPAAQVWRFETLVRFAKLPNDSELQTALETYAADPYLLGVIRRAWAIWLTGRGQYLEAHTQFEHARQHFASDPYEAARTQVDWARNYLMSEVGELPPPPLPDLPPPQPPTSASVASANALLQRANATFSQLGAILMQRTAQDLAQSLVIGRGTVQLHLFNPPLTRVNLLWVGLEGEWSNWNDLFTTARLQGGLPERLLGGLAVLFPPASAEGVVLETAFALHDVLTHHQKNGKFHIVVGQGNIPYDPQNLLYTMRALPRAEFFQTLRGTKVESRQIWANNQLYLHTYLNYNFQNAPRDESHSQKWWIVPIPQQTPTKLKALRRATLKGYENIWDSSETVLSPFRQKQVGGMLMVTGEAGAGKSVVLNTLISEWQSQQTHWLIHLKGRAGEAHQPFGAIRAWLGLKTESQSSVPRERHLAHIATFRRSVSGLLATRPLVLAVDDIHLLDSGSLEALRAVMPLLAAHPLLMIMTALPSAELAIQTWQPLFEVTKRAVPERCLTVHLSDDHAYRPSTNRTPHGQRDHVLACAAVLGDKFSSLILRRISLTPDLEAQLKHFQSAGVLTPTDEPNQWRFTRTAQRDYLYNNLPPDYRALLHWYARQTLKHFGFNPDPHIHPSGLVEPALTIGLRRAQEALDLDCPREALLQFDRALSLYEGSDTPFELQLGKAEALLSLGDLEGAQTVLNLLQKTPHLNPRQEVSLMIFQGELHYRVGEIASLFQLYDEAASKLSALPSSETDLSEQISLLYAQALGRFKRQEYDLARSLSGKALLLSQQESLAQGFPHFWELIAKIHHERGQNASAQKAIRQALKLRRQSDEVWLLLEPLEHYGVLLMQAGDLIQAQQQLKSALDLAEAIGDAAAIIRLNQNLGKIANYRGDFGHLTNHLSAALNAALFADDPSWRIMAHAALAEGLMLEGRLVHALQQATLALHLAEVSTNHHLQALAQVAIAQVTLALNCLDDAEQALNRAEQHVQTSTDPINWEINLLLMQLGLRLKQEDVFQRGWQRIRRLYSTNHDDFLRARSQLLAGEFRGQQEEWNDAVREFETASRTFAKLGASYWQRLARTHLTQIAPNIPNFSIKTTP